MIPIVNLPGPKSAPALLTVLVCGARVFGRNEHRTSRPAGLITSSYLVGRLHRQITVIDAMAKI
jgi:hypothetical protein